MNLANYSVTFAEYLQYWGQPNRQVAIGLYLLLPLSINFLNVRKYGEFEFWVTLVKITVVIIIIIVGGVIAAGGTPLLLGLDKNYRTVPCSENAVSSPCVEPPGFICSSSDERSLMNRLEKISISTLYMDQQRVWLRRRFYLFPQLGNVFHGRNGNGRCSCR